MVKNDLASDRTSDRCFLANHLRLFFSCAAYVLHQALRAGVLAGTELAKAQPLPSNPHYGVPVRVERSEAESKHAKTGTSTSRWRASLSANEPILPK